jgi:polyisoprenoid-binding protein YceI
MITKRAGLPAAAAAVVILAGFAAVTPRNMTFTPESRIWVDGTSTVKSWTCQAGVPEGAVTTKAAIGSLGDVAAAVGSATLAVQVAAMNCDDNNKMNEHMRKALKAEEAPAITFEMASAAVAAGEDGQWVATLKGTLTMAGETKPVQIDGTAALLEDGTITLKGVTALNMKEWGMKPPSLFLGTMKVGENVQVHFDVVLDTID